MKRLLILTIILVGAAVAFAQDTETRNLSSFKNVSASQGIDVYLSKGSSETARVEVDGNIELEEVLTEVSGSTLRIHLDGNNYRGVDVTVYVTYKSLEGLKASSAASIEVKDQVKCDCDFEIDVSSAGDVEVNVVANTLELEASSAGDIEVIAKVNSIEASASSAGDIEIEGSAEEIEASASSSGDISGYDLVCQEAELKASSGGSIKLSVENRIRARASSGGSISYKGNPEYTDKESSSGGSVRKN